MENIQTICDEDYLNIENSIENIEAAIREHIHNYALEKVVYDDNNIQVQRLTTENSDLEATLKVVQEAYNRSRQELEQLKQENAHLTRTSEDRLYQLSALRTELNDAMDGNAQLRMELARSQTHVDKLTHTLTEYKDGIQSLKVQVDQGRQEARRRMQLEQDLHRQRLEWERERMELERKLEDVMLSSVNVSTVVQQKESLRLQCDNLTTQLQQLKTQLRDSQQDMTELRKQAQMTKSRLSERERELAHAQELLRTASNVPATLCANCGTDTNDAMSKLMKTREVLQRQLIDAMGALKRMDSVASHCTRCGPMLKRGPTHSAGAGARPPAPSNRVPVGAVVSRPHPLPAQARPNTHIPHSVFLSPGRTEVVVDGGLEDLQELANATSLTELHTDDGEPTAGNDKNGGEKASSVSLSTDSVSASVGRARVTSILSPAIVSTSRYSAMSIINMDDDKLTEEAPKKKRRALSRRSIDDGY